MLKIRVINISKKDLTRRSRNSRAPPGTRARYSRSSTRKSTGLVRRRALRLPGGRLLLRPQSAGRGIAGRDGQDCRGGACSVHCAAPRRLDPDGILAGTGQSARPDQDLPDARIRRPGDRCANRTTPAISAWRCRAFWRACPTAPRPTRSRISTSRKTPTGRITPKYAWANSAYAMAANINRAFKNYGWCSRIRGIESGGAVEGLPTHTFPTDDGGVDMKCPTEIAISDRREAELAKNGFMPLVHRKNSDFAAFIGAQSLHKPAEYDDPDATANAALAARLALSVRHLPLCALLEVHRARQDRFLQGSRRHGEVAEELDRPICRWRSGAFQRSHQGAQATRGRGGHRRGSRGQSRLLRVQVLPSSPLPTRRADVSLRLVSKLPSAKAS